MSYRRCLETRQGPGYIRRRYELSDGSRVTSYEFFEGELPYETLQETLKQASLGLRRPQTYRDPSARNRAVLEGLAAGETHRSLAKRLRISTATTCRIAKENRE